jgi:putative lipoic acid-binding regulatory protein
MKTQDPLAIRVSPMLRGLALLLDLGIFAGLSVALVYGINSLTVQLLGGSGANFNASLVSFPVLVLYILYSSSELMINKTIGKQLVGIEIRAENGMSAHKEALFRRYVVRHGWALFLFLGYIIDSSILYWITMFWVGVLGLGGLSAFGKHKQTFYDKSSKLAIYPNKAPKADLSLLSKGKSESELISEAKDPEKLMGTSASVKRTAKATLKKKDFPCAVELNIYVKGGDEVEGQIFDCFAQFVSNIHPNQVQLSNKTKGPYRICRVVMKFDSPIQMETSYAALAKLSSVVTTITIRSVKVKDGKKGKAQTNEILNAQTTLS